MTRPRVAVPLGLAVALAIAGLAVAPRAFEAERLLAAQDDPAALADYAVARSFNAAVAEREISSALAANDPDLAKSFLDLARDHKVPVEPALSEKVDLAVAESASTSRSLESFARGFVTGEPEDLAGLAGTAVGDLFVFGDIRDAVREGSRLATGEEVNELILGLACVGLAVTAGTYATVGLAAPARAGLTVVKAAGKSGRIGSRMMAWISRSVQDIVDWSALSRASRQASITEPALAVRAAREAVKVEKARDLVGLAGNVGRVQARAGTQAALDGLRLAEGPRDMSRVARLAAAKGGKTRAILKLAGRGALLLTVGAFNLAMWLFWAVLTMLGFVCSLKRMTERATERYCARRKLRRARALLRQERERRLPVLAPSAEEPTLIYSTAPFQPISLFQKSNTPPGSLREPPPDQVWGRLSPLRGEGMKSVPPLAARMPGTANHPAVPRLPTAPVLVLKPITADRASFRRTLWPGLTAVPRNEIAADVDRLADAVASLRGLIARSA